MEKLVSVQEFNAIGQYNRQQEPNDIEQPAFYDLRVNGDLLRALRSQASGPEARSAFTHRRQNVRRRVPLAGFPHSG